MKKYLTTLSEMELISNAERTVTSLFLHMMYAEVIQSKYFPADVTSLPDIFYKNDGDIEGLIESLRKELTEYFNAYFEEVEVDVTDDTEDPDAAMRVLGISMKIVDIKGEVLDLRYVLEKTEENTLHLIHLNNTGERTYASR